MLSVHLDYRFCQPEKSSRVHSDQELRRMASVVASLLRYPTLCQTTERIRRGRQTTSLGRRGLPHVGAATLVCGLGQCNQAWGISAWITMSGCWNAQTSDRSARGCGFMSRCLVSFHIQRKETFQTLYNRGDDHFFTCGSSYPKYS